MARTSRKAAKIARTEKVAIYIRVSTKWQIDKDSLPLQRDELPKYAEYVLGIKQYEIFEDAGYSAKNTDRPAFQQMMTRIRAGEFSHILVWKIDRISRNLLDFSSMYQELKDYGVTFVSKNEQFDTSSAIGEAMLKIILIFAELERNMTSERVTAVMLSRAEQGQWNGGKIPYGYILDIETKEFSIDEKEASVVRMMYDMYRKERSLLKVSQNLNEMGIMPRSGKPWSPVTISIILKNPFYCGKLRYNYRDQRRGTKNQYINDEAEWVVFDDHHPAIVSEEDWQGACLQLEANRRTGEGEGNKVYKRKHVHIFAGLLTCGYCGSNMSATLDRVRASGWRPSIYNCSRHRRFSDCANKYVSDVTLGPFVLNYIANLIKARRSFGKTTSIETFQKKLLRGTMFAEVDHIERQGLEDMYNLIKAGKSEISFRATDNMPGHEKQVEQRSYLVEQKQRLERAVKRLTAAYLYDDSDMPEKDYIIEKKKLADSIATIDTRIRDMDKEITNSYNMSDDEFMEMASYFIVSQRLTDRRFVNYEAFIKAADPQTVRSFITSVIQNFCILDGKITSITFRNGIIHKFLYVDNE